MRCVGWFGVAEAAMRCAGGEFEGFEGAISTYDDLSWGAGEGAIAMAVLMMFRYCANAGESKVVGLSYTFVPSSSG